MSTLSPEIDFLAPTTQMGERRVITIQFGDAHEGAAPRQMGGFAYEQQQQRRDPNQDLKDRQAMMQQRQL